MGDTLVAPGTVGYAEKKNKPFWIGSLDEMVPFDTLNFRGSL